VASLQRIALLPQVPTVSENALVGFNAGVWFGIAAPAKTPRDVVARLNREINAILASPDMRQKLADQGADAIGGTPEAFAEHAKRERDKWSRVIREAGISVN